jgi:hypothetical protein
MNRSLLFLFATGCLGTRDVVPEWLDENNNDGSEEEHEEVVIEDADCGGSDTGDVSGFAIFGSIEDISTREGPTNPEALCSFALDPTPVLAGGDPVVMAASAVCENGEYYVGGLADPPSIGMFISIADCDASNQTVMKSATGVDYDDVASLGDGEEYGPHTAYLVTLEQGQVIGEALVDYTGDAVTAGFMAGFVLDVDDQPVDGATLGGGGVDFYYMDSDPSDGLFLTDGERNTQTEAAARSTFVGPGAPIFSYTAEDGGTHTWDPQLFGSLPGYASFLLFNAIN